MDGIVRTLICDGQVSLAVIDTTGLVNDAIKIHRTEGVASAILGGLLTCAAYFASSLKDENGSVSITVKAKDGDGAVSVSADAALHIRGYADGTCKGTLIGGTMTVVREDGRSLPFVGTCEIDSDDISEIFQKYFQVSEQIPTVVALGVDIGEDGVCKCAGGIVEQLLPEAEDMQIMAAAEAYRKFKYDGLPVEKGINFILDRYFFHLGCGETTTCFPEYKCNCSENKIRGVLASVGKAELINIAEELGEVKVHCHYCNKDYIYDKKRIEEIF